METITICIGSFAVLSNGEIQDTRRKATFEGEQLAEHIELSSNNQTDDPAGAKDATETLYRTEDGRLVLQIKSWSRWPGEPTMYSLFEVTENDLQIGGRFEVLGAKAGLGRPLTLDEALGECPQSGSRAA